MRSSLLLPLLGAESLCKGGEKDMASWEIRSARVQKQDIDGKAGYT